MHESSILGCDWTNRVWGKFKGCDTLHQFRFDIHFELGRVKVTSVRSARLSFGKATVTCSYNSFVFSWTDTNSCFSLDRDEAMKIINFWEILKLAFEVNSTSYRCVLTSN